MTAKYHAVLFDFDYTLGDTERGIVASTRYALEQMDLPQPPEEAIRRTIGLTLERSFTALTGSSDPAGQAKFSRLFNEKAEEVMVDSAVFYPGARELVDWLQASGTAVGGGHQQEPPPDRRHPAPGRDCSGGAGKRPGRQTEAGAGWDPAGGEQSGAEAGGDPLHRGQLHR